MDIRTRVRQLISKYETNDPFKICNHLKIIILYQNLGNIKGFTIKKLKRKVICINSELTKLEKTLVCAHELGHCLLHQMNDINFFRKNTDLIRTSTLEKEANEFALELLAEELEENVFFNSKINSSYFQELQKIKQRGKK